MSTLKVASHSHPNSLAGAIAGVIRESGKAEIQAIGICALNKAVKVVAIAWNFVAPQGVDLICIPACANLEINGSERTTIKLILEKL